MRRAAGERRFHQVHRLCIPRHTRGVLAQATLHTVLYRNFTNLIPPVPPPPGLELHGRVQAEKFGVLCDSSTP